MMNNSEIYNFPSDKKDRKKYVFRALSILHIIYLVVMASFLALVYFFIKPESGSLYFFFWFFILPAVVYIIILDRMLTNYTPLLKRIKDEETVQLVLKVDSFSKLKNTLISLIQKNNGLYLYDVDQLRSEVAHDIYLAEQRGNASLLSALKNNQLENLEVQGENLKSKIDEYRKSLDVLKSLLDKYGIDSSI